MTGNGRPAAPATFWVGRDFGVGFTDHAVPQGSTTAGSPRPARFEGYKVPYRALCGRQVWLPTDRDYRKIDWPRDSRTCKTCLRQAEKKITQTP